MILILQILTLQAAADLLSVYIWQVAQSWLYRFAAHCFYRCLVLSLQKGVSVSVTTVGDEEELPACLPFLLGTGVVPSRNGGRSHRQNT